MEKTQEKNDEYFEKNDVWEFELTLCANIVKVMLKKINKVRNTFLL